ncbi:MAG: hypothetical protein KKG93_07255, partial [Bacteroidetes bacterium]|nr:hypothetical protein [Bacteroidota bacterium]
MQTSPESRSYNLSSTEEKYKFTTSHSEAQRRRKKVVMTMEFTPALCVGGARYYNAELGRWMSVDPLADKFPGWSRYNYVMNNPLIIVDPYGMGTLYVSDQNNRPQDDGTEGISYTADVYVVQNGVVVGVYPNGGSSYPNSVSNTDNSAAANTINEGEYSFNNASGHNGGTQQGLNIVDASGNRLAPGTSPTGNGVTMEYVNVHAGASNNGNFNSRGSRGCITLNPALSSNVLGHFNWNGNTGNSSGSV